VSVRGWAADSTTRASTRVDVYIGGVGRSVTANQDRPDVGSAYPSIGSAHGFSASWTVPGGTQNLCVYAISADTSTNATLACGPITVPDGSPFGSVDGVQAGPSGLAVRGWAIDPDTSAPLTVRVSVDGTAAGELRADGSRPDVGRAYPAAGSAHGFSGTVAITPGQHTVCLTAVNVQAGMDKQLAPCTTVTAAGSTPVGSLDAVAATRTGIDVRGWALDGDTTNPINVDFYVDGVWQRVVADKSRTDIARIYPAYGGNHGFAATLAAKPGQHQVCAYAINAGAGTANPFLGCATVTVTNAPPNGSLDSVSGGVGTVSVGGWAFDPDAPKTSVNVDVYVDGVGRRFVASGDRPDIARAFPAAGAAHGFQSTVPASPGQHTVCVYAIDTDGGTNPTLGCTTVSSR